MPFSEFPLDHVSPKLGAEDLGEGLNREIETLCGRQPLHPVHGQAASRDDEVEMGVILHLPSPGMEHGGKSRQVGAHEARISGQFPDRPACCPEHGAIGGSLMAAAERPELFGHGKGEHEVRAGQSAVKLSFEPLAAFVVLTLRAVPIAAGAVDRM